MGTLRLWPIHQREQGAMKPRRQPKAMRIYGWFANANKETESCTQPTEPREWQDYCMC